MTKMFSMHGLHLVYICKHPCTTADQGLPYLFCWINLVPTLVCHKLFNAPVVFVFKHHMLPDDGGSWGGGVHIKHLDRLCVFVRVRRKNTITIYRYILIIFVEK